MRFRPGVHLCADCEPVANPVCTTKRRCDCAPAGSNECCCTPAPNDAVLKVSPDDGRAMTCLACVAPIVFIDVNTGRKLAA